MPVIVIHPNYVWIFQQNSSTKDVVSKSSIKLFLTQVEMHYFIVAQSKSASNDIEYDDTKTYGETFHCMRGEESC